MQGGLGWLEGGWKEGIGKERPESPVSWKSWGFCFKGRWAPQGLYLLTGEVIIRVLISCEALTPLLKDLLADTIVHLS